MWWDQQLGRLPIVLLRYLSPTVHARGLTYTHFILEFLEDPVPLGTWFSLVIFVLNIKYCRNTPKSSEYPLKNHFILEKCRSSKVEYCTYSIFCCIFRSAQGTRIVRRTMLYSLQVFEFLRRCFNDFFWVLCFRTIAAAAFACVSLAIGGKFTSPAK